MELIFNKKEYIPPNEFFKGFPKETGIINNQGSQHISLLLFVTVDRRAVGSTSIYPIQLRDENSLHG